MKLQNDVALVTGAARGMGASHIRAMHALGARVVITDVLDDAGGALADELGERAIYVHLDVSQPSEWDHAVAVTEAEFGRVTVLVNNAGIASGARLHEFDVDEWNHIIGVNLTGVFLGMRAVADGMRELGRGAIVNTASIMGYRGHAGSYGYSASKWGILGLSKCAALELASHGVRVNTVVPGDIASDMSHSSYHDVEKGISFVPMKRQGSPNDVTQAVLFLISEESGFITGTEIVVDGGQLATLPSSLPDDIDAMMDAIRTSAGVA